MPQVSDVSSPTAAGSCASAPPFLCTLTRGGTWAAWVHVAGELDLLTSPELERTLRAAKLHGRLVVLDARAVTFIDSSGIRVILDASKNAEWGGAPLLLVAGAVVKHMLAVTGVREQISTFDLSPNEPAPPATSRLTVLAA
jgi:anti-anti-sigma factor